MLYSCQVSLFSDTKWQSYIGGKGRGEGLSPSIIGVSLTPSKTGLNYNSVYGKYYISHSV